MDDPIEVIEQAVATLTGLQSGKGWRARERHQLAWRARTAAASLLRAASAIDDNWLVEDEVDIGFGEGSCS